MCACHVMIKRSYQKCMFCDACESSVPQRLVQLYSLLPLLCVHLQNLRFLKGTFFFTCFLINGVKLSVSMNELMKVASVINSTTIYSLRQDSSSVQGTLNLYSRRSKIDRWSLMFLTSTTASVTHSLSLSVTSAHVHPVYGNFPIVHPTKASCIG